MECPSCGLELPEDSKFCNSCGSSVSGEIEKYLEVEENNKKNGVGFNRSLSKNKKALPIIILGLIVIIFISIYFFILRSEEERIVVMAAQDLKDMLIFPETLDFYEILVIYHTKDDEEDEYEKGDIKGVYLDYAAENQMGGRRRNEVFYIFDQESGSVNYEKGASMHHIKDREEREAIETIDEIMIQLMYRSARDSEAYVEFENERILNQLK